MFKLKWKNAELLLLLIFSLLFYLPYSIAVGATNYRVQGEIPKYPANDFKEDEQARVMATIKIVATTKDAFSDDGEVYRAEFRLPRDFYITSAGFVDDGIEEDLELERGAGFEDNSREIQINLIAEERNNPGHYRGFELVVQDIPRPDDYPELVLHFNRVVVPRGFRDNVTVTVDSEESAFSEGTFTIARIQSARLTVEVSEQQFLVGNTQTLGPIKVSENMPATFEYIDLILPGGYTWDVDSCYIDPMLGLRQDLNNDGRYDEKDFLLSVENDKYGQSVLHIEILNQERTATIGKMEILCNVDVEDGSVSYGDVNLRLESNADLNTSSLKVATFSQQKIDLKGENIKEIYGGLCAQKTGDIVIAENAPETLIEDRKISIELPEGAKWSTIPSVQLEGDNYLDISPLILNAERDRITFEVEAGSLDRPGKIRLKEGKVDLAIDFMGNLIVKIGGSARISGEATIANVKPPLTVNVVNKPDVIIGKQEQVAGDLEISEAAVRTFLARDLWIEFPEGIRLNKPPRVEITEGDIRISRASIHKDGERERLIIPVQNSSSQKAKLVVKDIVYDLNRVLPDGDLLLKVGGPAVNEVNSLTDPLFPEREWVCEVANATAAKAAAVETIPIATQQPVAVSFKIGESSYQVNGEKVDMDTAPCIVDGRTFVPVRYVAQALGLQAADILWEDREQRVTLKTAGNIVQLKTGEKAIYRNGIKVSMDAASYIKDGRTMVPMRALTEAFGAKITWDAATSSISIIRQSTAS